jgi:outer membrane protein assembly factor BamA
MWLFVVFIGLFGQQERQPVSAGIPVVDSIVHKTLTVNKIIILGNKVTRDRIILRELSLKPGDTISDLKIDEVLALDRNKIYNLRLFQTVTVRWLSFDQQLIDLIIEVNERWYLFPSPILEIADRNFNEWWQNYDHDLKRINYGVRIYQHNFRGRNEYLRFTAQFGFIRKFLLTYRIPNIGKSQKHGLWFDFDYGEPKNVAYATQDHTLEFLKLPTTVKTTFGSQAVYSYRRSFYETHSLSLEYRKSSVVDSLPELNPYYYFGGARQQQFKAISYTFNSEHRDVVAYPMNGYQFTAFVSKIGLGLGDDVDMAEINITYAVHKDLGYNYNLSNFTSGYFSTPNNQPYSLYGALGYRRQFLRGYEVNVIEGPRFFLNKTTLKKRIFSKIWNLEGVPLEQFRHFPLSIYLKTYFDFGYVSNYQRYEDLQINTRLSDRWLGGTGAGLDLVLAYDAVFRFEYTFTNDRTKGFFFHVKKEF